MERKNYKKEDINYFISAMNGEVSQEYKEKEQKKILARALELYKKQKEGIITLAEKSEIKLLSIKHGNYKNYFLEINSKIENSEKIDDVDEFIDSIIQSR